VTAGKQLLIWLVALAVFVLLLVTLRGILLPFVVGMAIAYILDPVCDMLERWGLSRKWATTVVTLLFVLLVVVALISIVPLLLEELTDFLTSLPDLIRQAQNRLIPLYQTLHGRLHLPAISELDGLVQDRLGNAVTWLAQALQDLLGRGLALASLLSLFFITPVVTFYLLRDWDLLVGRIDSLLPRQHAQTVQAQMREIDRTLAGFARGQATVCLTLATYYAVALAVIGLPFGIVVGLVAGILTFIPYVGATTGFVVSLAIALAQFGDWTRILMVVGVFVVGQALEGNVLTPKLVGDRVGLHPVWIIFALLAGGALFGFLGLLLAVPVAASLGVLVRFFIARYLESSLYRSGAPIEAEPAFTPLSSASLSSTPPHIDD
jgi:predicted PurR-regulated permease PerM